MKTLFVALCLSLAVSAAQQPSDDLSIVVDPKADFSGFRTFAVRGGKIDSARPELDNTLFAKKITRTIQTALVARGLRETSGRPDLLVDYSITNEDINTTQRGGGRGIGPQPLRFTVGMLVIDLLRPGDAAPVWRGIYRDAETTGSKLVQKLAEDAKKLIAKYPGR